MIERGILYVVATPIGNLDDISNRALQVLNSVDIIAAEDTRHSKGLLQRFQIKTQLQAYHDFSSDSALERLLNRLNAGQSIALISDAGTPLISDPGYRLVSEARKQGIDVLPIPGASALIAALSVAGLPTDRFIFEGFLPAKSAARIRCLKDLAAEKRTLVFYESSHRIEAAILDMGECFGSQRRVFVGRELTKKFETHFIGDLTGCLDWLQADANQQKGEFVVVIHGHEELAQEDSRQQQALELVRLLREEMSLKRAVALASKFSGARKNRLYEAALADDSGN